MTAGWRSGGIWGSEHAARDGQVWDWAAAAAPEGELERTAANAGGGPHMVAVSLPIPNVSTAAAAHTIRPPGIRFSSRSPSIIAALMPCCCAVGGRGRAAWWVGGADGEQAGRTLAAQAGACPGTYAECRCSGCVAGCGGVRLSVKLGLPFLIWEGAPAAAPLLTL